MKPQQIAQIHYEAAVQAAQILEQAGYEVYLIGGAVRDLLLGKLPKDFDLVTSAQPPQILALPGFSKSRFDNAAQAFGVTRVMLGKSEIEITTYRRDIEAHLGRKQTKVEFAHLEDDLQRRDFSVNALALDPLNDYLVDEVGGLADLEDGLIRFIGEPSERITEDPLRILRGIRLKNQLGFNYESATKGALQAAISKGELAKVATDRVRQELNRLLVHSSRVDAIADLDELGALEKLLPELVAAKGVSQPTQFHAEGDVYEHTLLALGNLPPRPSHQLVWATLLHDIGKPPTRSHQSQDRIRFNEHYKVGAQLARDILKRFNFSKRDIETISWLVHYHLAIDELPRMRPGHAQQMLSHPGFAELLALHKADAKAAWGKDGDAVNVSQPDFSELDKLWETYQLQSHTQPLSLKSELGIDGDWLKREFKLAGKQLGKILKHLQEAYLEGTLKTEPEARAMVKRLLAKQ